MVLLGAYFRLTSCLALLAVFVAVGHVSAETILPTPTHHYTFDVDASDSAGTNDGTPMNGAAIVTDPVRGNVLDLDGVDDYVKLQYSNIPGGPTGASVFTIAGWVKIPAGNLPWEQRGGIYGEENSIQLDVKNFLFVNVETDTGSMGEVAFAQWPPRGGDIFSQSTVNDGIWHHIAYVQNESSGYKQKLYLDGSLDGYANSPEAYGGASPDLWSIGARFGGNDPSYPTFTEGRIDDLRFYDVALNADQIATLAVPEPSTLILLTMGAVGLLAYARRRRRCIDFMAGGSVR